MQALHSLMLGQYCGFPACLNLGSRRTLLYNDCRLCMYDLHHEEQACPAEL